MSEQVTPQYKTWCSMFIEDQLAALRERDFTWSTPLLAAPEDEVIDLTEDSDDEAIGEATVTYHHPLRGCCRHNPIVIWD